MSLRKHMSVLWQSLRAQREHERSAQVHEETAFLPGALAVLETPPNPIGRAVLWTLLAIVGAAFTWACLGQVDVVAVASGKVIPRGRVRMIQAADIGVVRAIHVREGMRVRAGQPLIVLDPTATQADAAQARESLMVAQIDRARALALVAASAGDNQALQLPADTPLDIALTQQRLLGARLAEHRTELAALREEREQRNAELSMVSAEVAKITEQLPLATDQLESLQKLGKEGLVPRMRVMEVEERVIGLRQDLVIRNEEISRNRAALASVESQMSKLKSTFRAQALDSLSEAEANYRLRAEEVKKANDRASLTVLASPIDGTVTQLAVHTLGAVVKPADALLAIVPQGEELIVEAMVLNRDIGFVHEGQPVEVKLEAFPFTRYGVVSGTIETLSSDAIDNEQLGLVFPCQVRIAQSYVSVGTKRVALAAGFAATAEIKTGRRRIIEYLLSPLARRLQEAGRER